MEIPASASLGENAAVLDATALAYCLSSFLSLRFFFAGAKKKEGGRVGPTD